MSCLGCISLHCSSTKNRYHIIKIVLYYMGSNYISTKCFHHEIKFHITKNHYSCQIVLIFENDKYKLIIHQILVKMAIFNKSLDKIKKLLNTCRFWCMK